MDIRPIRTEKDYDWALKEIARYFDNEPKKGTPAANRFDVLVALIGAYEDREWPIDCIDPIEAIMAYMELRGIKQAGLAEIVGSRSRASEILHKKRPLTLDMVRRISSRWHAPADVLIQPYHLATRERR